MTEGRSTNNKALKNTLKKLGAWCIVARAIEDLALRYKAMVAVGDVYEG